MINLLGTLLDLCESFVRERWPVMLVVALTLTLSAPAFPRVISAFERLARRRLAAGVTVLITAILTMSVAFVFHGVPRPRLSDEWTYLLAGEMYAHGHFAMPAHPLGAHFQSPQQLETPTYASKYPPGQGLVLALGLLLCGIPIAGAVLIAIAAVMAVWWALTRWLSPPWALAGGLLMAIHPMALFWGQFYLGGGLAALGGALLFGAIVDVRNWRWSDAITAGSGVAMLSIARPFEGLVLTIACGLAIVPNVRRRALLLAPVALAFALTGPLLIGIDNHAVTGSATKMPWLAYADQFDRAPPFIWTTAAVRPDNELPEMHFLHDIIYMRFYRLSQGMGVFGEAAKKLDCLTSGALFGEPSSPLLVSLWPLFIAPLLMLPLLLNRDRTARRVALIVGLYLVAPLALTGPLLLHYLGAVAAPAAALLVLLLREMCAHRRTKLLAMSIVLLFVVNAIAFATRPYPWDGDEKARAREDVERALGPGRHLIVAAPDLFGVVWNGANIDASPVVWAHSIGDDAALYRYYSGRRFWTVRHDGPRRWIVEGNGRRLLVTPPATGLKFYRYH